MSIASEEPLLEDRVQGRGNAGRDDSGACPHRGLGREARRAGIAGGAADDEDSARGVLVIARTAPRDELEHLPTDQAVACRDVSKPDVDDLDLAGLKAPWRDGEAHLAPMERDRQRRLDCRPGDLARRRVDPGRDVDRNDREREPVELLEPPGRLAPGRPREACPEDGVDRDVRGARLVCEADAQLLRAAQILGGVAHDLLLGTDHPYVDLSAREVELPRSHEPVPAVRTGATPDGDAPRVRIAGRHRLRDGGPGPFHQLERQPVVRFLGRPHLGRRVERLRPHPRRRRSPRRARASASSRGRAGRPRRAPPMTSSNRTGARRASVVPRSRSRAR